MDESFSMPGGGFVNLDFFERMVLTPGVTLVTMLGEGSFHQVHGGTTTNVTEPRRAGQVLRRPVRGAARAPLPDSAAAGALRRQPAAGRPAHEAAADDRLPALQERPRERRRRTSRPADAGPAGPEDRVHRRVLAQRRVAPDLVARQVDAQAADRPARLPGADLPACGPSGSSRPAPGTGGRALFLASICDLDRIRPGALDRRLPARRALPIIRGSPTCAAIPPPRTTAGQAREIVGEPPAGHGHPRRRRPAPRSSAPSATTRRWSPSAPTSSSRTRSSRETRFGTDFGSGPGDRRSSEIVGRGRVRARPLARALRAHLQRRGLPEARALTGARLARIPRVRHSCRPQSSSGRLNTKALFTNASAPGKVPRSRS